MESPNVISSNERTCEAEDGRKVLDSQLLNVCCLIRQNDDCEELPKQPRIPTPNFTLIEDFSVPNEFKRPDYYIHSIPSTSSYTSYMLSSSDLEYYDEELPDIPLKSFDKIIEKWEKKSGNSQVISKKTALEGCKFSDTSGLEAVYQYWLNKRKRVKMPLLRQFWKSVERSDENLMKVFCRRKGEKMKLRSVKGRENENKIKALKLFCNLQECREILVWVLRREALKLNLVKLRMMEFEYKRADLAEVRFSHKEFEEVLRESIVENSLRFRNPRTYLNVYQKEIPKANLRN
jgi:enhancer of polycomb-like protein